MTAPKTSPSDWVEIVPPVSLDQGREEYERWLHENGLDSSQIEDDDIRVDVIRTRDGSRMRYVVRKAALAKLGL